MRLLLDTHIWLWSLLEPSKLGGRVRRALDEVDNELWLSPISVWELSMLVDKKRVSLSGEVRSWVARAFDAVPLKEAPLTHEIALATIDVVLRHTDPADRFLVATARVLGLTLVTADERLIRSRAVPILAQR